MHSVMVMMILSLIATSPGLQDGAEKSQNKCVSDGDDFDCCGKLSDPTFVRVTKAKNAFTDLPTNILMKPAKNQYVGVRHVSGDPDTYHIIWAFPETERPVFIIDDDHRTLPGVIRAGKLEARPVRWSLESTTMLIAEIQRGEFWAIGNGLAIQVENTWLQPKYTHVLDFSCPAAWELISEKDAP